LTARDIGRFVTNAAIHRPPIAAPRHQFDYAFHCPELRSVDFTAAANDNLVLRAVDATDASFRDDEMQSVCETSAGCDTIPEPKKGPFTVRPTKPMGK